MATRGFGLLSIAGFFLLNLCGCNPKVDDAPPKDTSTAPAVALKTETPKEVGKTAAEVVPAKPASFRDDVILDPPEGEMRPPDKTAAGKSVPKMYEAISAKGGLWEGIPFVSAEGKKIRYTADVKTDLGTIQIELYSDAAPNHVRNFIALARVGYFEGLNFHRSLRQEAMGGTFAYLEAGCPKGTGDVGYGSIGYWLRPEISSKHSHEEGTIGAWHAEEMDTASCRFYVTLCKAPAMDRNYTIFGKIVAGLDVAHTINARPTQPEGFTDRPINPVVIRTVTIHAKVLD